MQDPREVLRTLVSFLKPRSEIELLYHYLDMASLLGAIDYDSALCTLARRSIDEIFVLSHRYPAIFSEFLEVMQQVLENIFGETIVIGKLDKANFFESIQEALRSYLARRSGLATNLEIEKRATSLTCRVVTYASRILFTKYGLMSIVMVG